MRDLDGTFARSGAEQGPAGGATGRVSLLIFRKYMEAMHQSSQCKDDRICRLLRQLEESRAEAQILRLAPSRDGDPADYDMYQARLAASDREQLRANQRMLQQYDEREEDSQRALHQMYEMTRFLTQRIDALLLVQDKNLGSNVAQELERIMQTAYAALPHDEHPPDFLGREMGNTSGRIQNMANRTQLDINEIVCKRKSIDKMSREIELLLRENETLQQHLAQANTAKHFEVQDAIQQALASVDERGDKEKSNLIARLHHMVTTYIRTYMHTCINTYTHTNMHTYVHACTHTNMHTYVHTCAHTNMHTYIHPCTHTNMHARMLT